MVNLAFLNLSISAALIVRTRRGRPERDLRRLQAGVERGRLPGLFLAALAIDVHVTDTYFIIAHFHYIMVGGSVSAYIGGLYFWFPKMFGRMYSEFWGKVSAMVIFLGFNLTFFPQFILGFLGMPRRYASYPSEFQVLNIFSTLGGVDLGCRGNSFDDKSRARPL